MAIAVFDPDYARFNRKESNGHIAMPKCSANVAHKAKWDLDKLDCRLSTSVVDLSDLGSRKKHHEELLS